MWREKECDAMKIIIGLLLCLFVYSCEIEEKIDNAFDKLGSNIDVDKLNRRDQAVYLAIELFFQVSDNDVQKDIEKKPDSHPIIVSDLDQSFRLIKIKNRIVIRSLFLILINLKVFSLLMMKGCS